MNIGTTWEKFDRLLEDRKQKERLRQKRERKINKKYNIGAGRLKQSAVKFICR